MYASKSKNWFNGIQSRKRLFADRVSANKKLFAVTVSANKKLYNKPPYSRPPPLTCFFSIGTPLFANNFLFADIVSANNFLFADTLSANNLFQL